jgi:hypothetical protein
VQLEPYDFQAIETTDRNLKLCIGKVCNDFVLNPTGINYIQCTFKETEKVPALTLQVEKEAEFYYNKLRKDHENGINNADKEDTEQVP